MVTVTVSLVRAVQSPHITWLVTNYTGHALRGSCLLTPELLPDAPFILLLFPAGAVLPNPAQTPPSCASQAARKWRLEITGNR